MIYISSSAINTDSIKDCIKKLVGLGIFNIELSGGIRYAGEILETLEKYKKEFFLNFLIHNYFPAPKKDFVLNIASSNETARLNSINFAKRTIDLAHALGINLYTLHAGYARELKPGRDKGCFIPDGCLGNIDLERARSNMFSSLKDIEKYASLRKVKIGLENLFPFDSAPGASLLCIPAEIFQFLDYFAKNDNVGLLLDLGHLSISANRLGFNKNEFIKTLSKDYPHKIFGIHLSGNNGKFDLHVPLSPDSWQLKAIKNYGLEEFPLTVECRKLEPEEILKQVQIVEKNFERSI